MFNLGWMEILILAFLGLLIFGKRLPEVGRNLGKSIVEFKKGLADAGNEINKSSAANGSPEAPGEVRRLNGPPPSPAATAPSGTSSGANPAGANDDLQAAREELRALREKIEALESKSARRI